MHRLSEIIDRSIRLIGDVFAWAMLLLMVAIVTLVILNEFKIGSIKLEELQWHLYAAGMMIGISYAFLSDAHIRVDVLQHRFSRKTRAAIDVAGTLCLLFPFLIFLFWQSLQFVHQAMMDHESSDSPSGLPWRWIIKSFIPLGCLLLLLSGLSHLIRSLADYRKN